MDDSGTPLDSADTLAPLVIATSPTDGALQVANNSSVFGTFNEAIDPATLTAATFTLEDADGLATAGTVTSFGAAAVRFTPAADLDPAVEYIATLTTGVADLSGNSLEEDYVWSFTVAGFGPDLERPTVLMAIPHDGAIGVGVDVRLHTTFSEAMDPATISEATIELMDASAALVPGTVFYDVPTNMGTFVSDVDLLPGSQYTGIVTTDVADLAGNTMLAQYSWGFMTAEAELDILPPFVLATDPADLDVDVPVDTLVDVLFSEAMDPTTISEATIQLMDPTASLITGSVFYDVPTNMGTFVSDVDLLPGTLYTGIVTAGVADVAGNNMLVQYTWAFMTEPEEVDLVPPFVLVTDPTDLEIDVAIETPLSIWFSEPMDPLTISETTVELLDPDFNVVTGTVSYDVPMRLATFVPDDDLLPGRVYTAMVTTGATDDYGNPLVEDYAWTFTTTLDDWVLDPVPLGTLSPFVAVAGAGLTNSNSAGTTTLGGDVALSGGVCLGDGIPCTSTNPVILGTLYVADTTSAQAQVDLSAAYVDAMARPAGTSVSDISGMTLPPGVYTASSTLTVAVGSTVILDGEGDENSVWIFQIGSSLTVSDDAQIVLINGAKADNVYWAAFASTTLGANVSFQGNVFAGASNSVGEGANVVGRLLCTTGAITLLSNNITLP